jgi:hypothetical protein
MSDVLRDFLLNCAAQSVGGIVSALIIAWFLQHPRRAKPL